MDVYYLLYSAIFVGLWNIWLHSIFTCVTLLWHLFKIWVLNTKSTKNLALLISINKWGILSFLIMIFNNFVHKHHLFLIVYYFLHLLHLEYLQNIFLNLIIFVHLLNAFLFNLILVTNLVNNCILNQCLLSL